MVIRVSDTLRLGRTTECQYFPIYFWLFSVCTKNCIFALQKANKGFYECVISNKTVFRIE